MEDAHVIWDLPDEPRGNVRHIADHGVTPDEVEEVLRNPKNETIVSESSGHQVTFGYTTARRFLAVVWEHIMDDPLTMRPITAYDAEEPAAKSKLRRRRRRR